jgi:hypothetical protein
MSITTVRAWWFNFIVARLAGAGLAIILFVMFFLYTSRFNVYEVFNDFHLGWRILWLIFYGYGIACSTVIDLIMLRIKKREIRALVRGPIYFIAGFTFFQVQGMNVYSIIAGMFGGLFALVFYVGTLLAGSSRSLRWIFALAAPLALLVLLQFDYTVKKGWSERSTGTSYEANFHYFNGRHEIPIYLDQGQELRFRVAIQAERGGYGRHLLDDRNRKVPHAETGSGYHSMQAQRNGMYRIVFTGNRMEGAAKVDWEVLSGDTRPGD